MMTIEDAHMICDECETVAHCLKNGCVPKQQALDRMAENARELGLDYEPVQELKMYEDWYDSSSCGHCGMVNGHRPECRHNYKTPAQPAPVQQSRSDVEPVAWSVSWHGVHCGNFFFRESDAIEHHKRLSLKFPNEKREVVALYTTPPNVATPLAAQRQWVHATPWRGLTDEEIKTVIAKIDQNEHYLPNALRQLSLAIEAKLKEKNCD